MMERSCPHYTKCAAPGDAHPFQSIGSIIGNALLALISGAPITYFAAAVASAISGAFIGWGCVAIIGVLSFALIEVYLFKEWYRNERLMCIHEGQCSIGQLVGNTWIAFDGDQKFDILIAPFGTAEVEDYFREVIQANPAQYGPGPSDPGSQALGEYIRTLSSADQTSLYMRVVHERMATRPDSQFQMRYLVRDEAAMGTAAFNATPDDTFASSEPNPMFRMNPGATLAPYLHQELEGNAIEAFLDNLAATLWIAIAAVAGLCAWLGPLGGLLGLALAALIWFIIDRWLNDPDDQNADQTDAGFTDPAFEGELSSIRLGDTVVVYGDWIAETQHGEYFEIHPVCAIYLVCRSEAGGTWEPINDLTGVDREGRCGFGIQVTRADYEQICDLVEQSENPDPAVVERRTVPMGIALSTTAGIQ